MEYTAKSSKGAFTIVAKNYIGLAMVLKASIQSKDPDVDFYIFVADEIPSQLAGSLPNNILEAHSVLSLSDDLWVEMAFKYNLTEFCTAIKPYCFQHMFDELSYEKVLYFDPDIYVYSSLSPLYDNLGTYNILVTPHILYPQLSDSSDRAFLQSGPYNLGFLGLRKSTTSDFLLKWWGHRLVDNCFDEVLEYTFTDQKWLLMIHSYIPQEEILVCRDLGLNVAPWNFKERKFVKQEDGYYIECRYDKSKVDRLVFVHYSGYDYRSLLEGKEVRPRVSEEQVNFEDVEMMMNVYVDALRENEKTMREYLNLPYTYGYYANGIQIEKFHRRLYHRLLEIDRAQYSNPFIADKGSLCDVLTQKGYMLKGNINGNSKQKVATSDVRTPLVQFNRFMRIVARLLGYRRYLMLLRLLKHFSRYESQVFLLDNKYLHDNMFIPRKQTL